MPLPTLANPVDLSLWHATAEPAPECHALSGATETDVAIIGAGFLGAATALALAERGVSAVLLEASEGPGGGASGRSGGQVIPGLRHDPALLVAEYGDRAAAIDAVTATDAETLFTLVRRLGIQCDAAQTGWVQALEAGPQIAEGAERVAQWHCRGMPVRSLGGDETAAILGSRAYAGGWLHPQGGHVQPLSYVRGLCRSAQAAGARVHARSPVLAMEQAGAGWTLRTPEGSVQARRVLLAANGIDGGLWPGAAQSVLPVWSFQVATPPLSDARRARLLPGNPSVSDTRRVLRYFRRDAAGRMVVGGKGTLRAPHRLAQFATVRRILARLYPELAHEPIEFAWGGRVSVVPGRWPRLARLGPGAWSAVLCNGKGVALTTAMAPHIATMLADGDEGAAVLPVGTLAPIPFHGLNRLYVAAGSAWLKLRDAMDRK